MGTQLSASGCLYQFPANMWQQIKWRPPKNERPFAQGPALALPAGPLNERSDICWILAASCYWAVSTLVMQLS